MKIHLLGPSYSVRRDRGTARQAGITNLIVVFRNFRKAPKNILVVLYYDLSDTVRFLISHNSQ